MLVCAIYEREVEIPTEYMLITRVLRGSLMSIVIRAAGCEIEVYILSIPIIRIMIYKLGHDKSLIHNYHE